MFFLYSYFVFFATIHEVKLVNGTTFLTEDIHENKTCFVLTCTKGESYRVAKNLVLEITETNDRKTVRPKEPVLKGKKKLGHLIKTKKKKCPVLINNKNLAAYCQSHSGVCESTVVDQAAAAKKKRKTISSLLEQERLNDRFQSGLKKMRMKLLSLKDQKKNLKKEMFLIRDMDLRKEKHLEVSKLAAQIHLLQSELTKEKSKALRAGAKIRY
ncbi:MAG: hypothetical protein CSA81_06250 [Acidobacteria bacterium]|nr:MAG: hypothetical protein CSA81_06250 [Acidobacteriota bacterium]